MYTDIKKLFNIVKGKDEKSMTRKAIVNSGYIFTTNAISRLGGLIFTILLARLLLPELFGIYNIVLSILLTIATVTDFGIYSALSRYLSNSLSKGKKGEKEARARVRFLFNLKIFWSFIISLILYLSADLISNVLFNKPELILPLQIGALYLFILAIQSFFATIFLPLNKVKYNLFSELIFQGSRVFLFFIFVSLYKSVSSVFWILTAAYAISLIFYFIVISIKNKKLFFGELIKIDKKKIIVFMGWATILSMSLVLFSAVNPIILGAFIENRYIGYYSTIVSIVGTVTAFVLFSSVFLPIFTEISGERLDRGFKKTIKYALAIAIPAAIGLMFVITPVIRIIYGAEYSPFGYQIPLLITSVLLSMLIIESVFSGMYNSLFMAKEKVKWPAIFFVIFTIAHIILSIISIQFILSKGQEWALVAIAGSTFILRYVNLGILGILAKKQMNLAPNLKDIIKPIFASLIMAGFLLAYEYLINPGIWLSILMIILAGTIYFLELYWMRKI